MMTLGQRIRALRDERDLSLREFATKIGCSAPFVSDVELGRRYPSDKLLHDMAQALGVKVDELKKHDTRPPVESMKERIAADPRYALAFRTVIDSGVSPDQLLKFASQQKGAKKPK